MNRRSRIATARAGFSLIETMIALVIFSVLGYGLMLTAVVGQGSQKEVLRVASEDRDLREASRWLSSELRSTSDANITVTALADNNHQLRFSLPITVGGAATWGVYDRRLGTTAAAQTQANWFVQYTVRNVAAGGGTIDRQLVRQILDAGLAVRREDVLAHGLRRGTDAPPGFRAVMNGAMWELTLSTNGPLAANAGKTTVMHVKTRN